MNKVKLLNPAVLARILQLYYHNCHNLISGETFFQDHSFMGDSYEAFEAVYDRFVEYYIATFGKEAFDTKAVITAVSERVAEIEVEKMCCCDMYKKGLELEQELYDHLETLNAKAPIGLQNMIGDVAEQLDIRKYKIQQRLLESEKD